MTELKDISLQDKINEEFRGYNFDIVMYDPGKPYDSYAVNIRTENGEVYSTLFTTPDMIRRNLEWIEQNHDPCGEGLSLCMGRCVIVKIVNPQTVKENLDHIIKNGNAYEFLKHIPKPGRETVTLSEDVKVPLRHVTAFFQTE